LLYLAGGADTFNMLVPLCNDLYGEYMAVRKNIGLTRGELLDISVSPESQACTSFGVHRRLPFVQQLYDDGELAFVSNIGNLVEPVTKATRGSTQRCAGEFSHSDQTNGAQTAHCQVSGTSPRGFGGRMAEALLLEGYRATSFSVAGAATWPQGVSTVDVQIINGNSLTGNSAGLRNYEDLEDVVVAATEIKYEGAYAEEYARQFRHAVNSSRAFGELLSEVQLATNYRGQGRLGSQFVQVARLIAARTGRQAERDFFYVRVPGWDHHRSVKEEMDSRLGPVNDALEEFVAELKGQNIFDSVVLVTMSEFGRTLDPNSRAGSDHAGAGNHFVLGGSISGSTIFNDFPESLLKTSDQDTGRGPRVRLMPKYPWESVMAPIAEWMGVDPSSTRMTTVFPNIANFPPELFIDRAQLFKNFDLV